MTDKRRDGAEAISIRANDFGERAAEDSRENDVSQEVFFHLGAIPPEMREKVKSFGISVGLRARVLAAGLRPPPPLRLLPSPHCGDTASSIIYERTRRR